jgi:hypothetical protein
MGKPPRKEVTKMGKKREDYRLLILTVLAILLGAAARLLEALADILRLLF